MDERDFFDERSDKKPATLNCPHCHQPAEYEIQWLVRTKKKNLPPRADERDRAKFAKAQSYMLRRDDMLMCKNMRCRKRFEITACRAWHFWIDGTELYGIGELACLDTWLRIAIFALILLSFLRRISKAQADKISSSPIAGTPGEFSSTLPRPQGKKNDFRDVPPPPENPELG